MKLTREQTQTIIDNGKLKGLSGKAVLDGLISRGYEPEGIDVNLAKQAITKEQEPMVSQKEPSMFERIKTGIQEKGQGVVESLTDENKSTLGKITGAGAEAAGAISGTIYNALPEPARGVLDKISSLAGKGMDELVNVISDNKFLQEAAMSGNTQKLEEGLRIASNLGTIAGETAGVVGATKALNKTADIASKGIGAIKDTTSKTVANLTPEELSKYPKQLADKISDKLTTLEPQVQNVLKTTSIEQFDDLVKKGEIALNDPRALKPKQLVGEKVLKQTLPAIKEDLTNIGSQKSKTLNSVSNIRIPDVGTSQIETVKPILQKNLTKAERKFVNDYIKELQTLGKNPSAGSVDAFVDKMQSTFFEFGGKNAIPVTTRVKSLINKSIGEINGKLKNSVDNALGSNDYSVLNDAYARKVKIFGELNKTIGIEGAKGGSLIERFTVGNDTGIKKLFDKVNKEYGVDLAKDATLAQFIEDSLGFNPASIYTKTVPLTKSGLATKAVNYAYKKIQNPIKKARKTIVESQAQ